MMDFDMKEMNRDIIYDKLSKSVETSTNLLHKKAISVVKGLKEHLGKDKLNGLEGIKTYTKNLMDLLNNLLTKISRDINNDHALEEDIKNAEALIFCLAICIKQLPFTLLRKITDKIVLIVDNFSKLKRFDIKKYSIIILERLFLSRSEEELANEHDGIVRFYIEHFFSLLEERKEDLHKCLIKSFSKILKTPNMINICKFTLISHLKNYLVVKIRGMCMGKDIDENKVIGLQVKSVATQEGEFMLKFLCSILQFLPFDFVNDLILELNDLIQVSDTKHILLNALLCFEVAFNTKSFALETNEKIIKNLLTKDLLNFNEDGNFEKNTNITTSLTIAYIKATTQVLLNLSKVNIFISMKYFSPIISLFGEFFSSTDEFLKNSIYNCLNNLLNHILSQKNVDVLMKNNAKNTDDDIDFEISLTSHKEDFNFIVTIEKLATCLLYFTSDRFEDLRPTLNLLYNFIEKINRKEYEEKITPIIEGMLARLSEQENLIKNQAFKVFLGKLFNLIKSSIILRYFPIQVLDFDICGDDYTETSKVWLISFIDKFLKNNNETQNLKEFFESFYLLLEDIEKLVTRLNNSKKRLNMDNGMEIDAMDEDLDERFMFDDESEHLRSIRLKRYQLIMQQIWNILCKYTSFVKDNYHEYVKEILKKFESFLNNTSSDEGMKEIVFKTTSKILQVTLRQGDLNTVEVLKKEGKVIFSKCLNMILNQKLSNKELKDALDLVTSFCKIFSEKYLCKIICDMIEKFDKIFTNDVLPSISDNSSTHSNKAKLNESLNFSMTEANTNNKKSNNSYKDIMNRLHLRIEVINYIFKNVKINIAESAVPSLLNSFFEKFYFNNKINNVYIKKKLMDLFLILLEKLNTHDNTLEIFNNFVNNLKGLEHTNSKQKSKLFEFILKILIKKLSENEKIDISMIQSQFQILVEIMSLTKDMNRKIRNTAYEMIGEITDFMTDSGLFEEWVKMILAVLASNSPYIKSAGINALARIFWQKRSEMDTPLKKLLLDTNDVVLLFFKENNKEITKSIFLFMRVLLYLVGPDHSLDLVTKILHFTFNETNNEIRNEFKVKTRNLIKSLIIKYSYEEMKKIFPKEQENLLTYINKHIVKKIKNMSKEDDLVYGGTKLDNSVMMDNDENLIDEEEEYIAKEFKKLEKKKRDEEEKFFERLDRLNIDEDDPELVKQKADKENNKNEKLDKIDQLFQKDNIELDNFFYVNPYAKENIKQKPEKGKKDEDDDVVFDKKKGKIIVKNVTQTNVVRNKQPVVSQDKPVEEVKKVDKLLSKKRVHNVGKDRDEVDDDNYMGQKVKMGKRKIDDNKSDKVVSNRRGKNKETHMVKFSGDEYKNKAGKGDKLLQGKYEPFAYIQLNPKSTSKKGRKDAVDVFKNIMKTK